LSDLGHIEIAVMKHLNTMIVELDEEKVIEGLGLAIFKIRCEVSKASPNNSMGFVNISWNNRQNTIFS
jgi:hypothetical protein